MANNISAVIPKLLAQGLMALRSTDSMPNLVNASYNRELKSKGQSVDIPIPSAIQAQDVVPSNIAPQPAGIAPTSASVTLDKWKEAPFFLSDDEVKQAMDGIIPMQASEAIKSIANEVNADILSKYKYFYGFVGTPGVTPFASDITASTEALTKLNIQLAPMGDRRMVLSPSAQGQALGLRHFNDINWGASLANITAGKMSPRLGFTFAMDQQVPTHITEATTGTVNGANQTGSSLALDGLDAPPIMGDVITLAGDAQTYAIIAVGTMTQDTTYSGTVTVSPQIKVAPADNAVVTFKATHVVNLAFHRDAIAFVSNPLLDVNGVGNVRSMRDPVSGITLRLEVSREYKRTRFSYDLLWGSQVVRPELGIRVAG
jgi:hypothetical protein